MRVLFALLVAQAPEPLYAPVIVAGREVAGEWTGADRLREGILLDRFTYVGQRRERVEIRLQSAVATRLTLTRVVGDGSRVIARGESRDGVTSLDVVLPAGGAYRLLAASAGEVGEGSYRLLVRSSHPLPARDWATIYPGTGDPGQRYALLVGVNDYPGTALDLQGGPLSDVTMMRDLLIGRLGFRPENVVVLRDVEGNREQVIEAFRRHLGQAGPSGVALFYYSGHGIQLPENRGLTGTADREADGKDEALALWGSQGELYGYLLDDELGILADELRAERRIVILDQCAAGTATRGTMDEPLSWDELGPGAVAMPEGLRKVPPPEIGTVLVKRAPWEDVRGRLEEADALVLGRRGGQRRPHLLLASSLANESSLVAPVTLADGSERSAGLFTTALYQALAAADRGATVRSLMEQVRTTVQRVAGRIRREPQTPHLEGAWQELSLAALFRLPRNPGALP